jgi:hypothetical protein
MHHTKSGRLRSGPFSSLLNGAACGSRERAVGPSDFEIGGEAAQHAHHARAVERVIARPHDDAGSGEPRVDALPRISSRPRFATCTRAALMHGRPRNSSAGAQTSACSQSPMSSGHVATGSRPACAGRVRVEDVAGHQPVKQHAQRWAIAKHGRGSKAQDTATALDHCKIRIAQRVVPDQCGLVGR